MSAFQIPIYPAETDIADKIIKSATLSSLAPLSISTAFEVPESLNRLCASERKNFDLFHLQSVLFSSICNDNDELFLPSETWYSRNTAKDKPFNYEHDCDDIIGHMTNSYAIDGNSNKISDDIDISQLPDLMHIISQAVLYKKWNKDDKQERMDKLLTEIPEGKWFVSVECLFPDFDYALKDKNGNFNIIARKKETAYLTKHLRMFNGEGVYDGCKLCRVPRNFIISGKGLTANPANKGSIILAHKVDFAKLNHNVSEKVVVDLSINEKLVYTSNDTQDGKVNKMATDIKLEDVQAENKKLQDALTKLQASVAEGEVAKVNAKLAEVQKDNEAKVQELNALKASVEKLNAEKIEAVKVADELIKTKASLEADLNKINEEIRKSNRLSAAKVQLKMKDEDAQVFVDSLDKLSDEAFTKFVELQAKLLPSQNSVTVPEVKTVETATIVKDAVQKATETKDDPALVVVATNPKDEMVKLQSKVSEYLSKNHIKVVDKPKFQSVN